MAIDRSIVEHVALLARIALTDTELATFTRQLADILAYVDKLNAVATDGVEAMEHTPREGNVVRDDAATPSLPPEKALEQAPKKAYDFFRVPKVVE